MEVGTIRMIELFCSASMFAKPDSSSPSVRTVLPRYPTARGPASASIDDAVDARTPAKLLKALPREFVLEPKSISIRRLPRVMPGKPDPPELNKPDTLLRIPPSDVGSLTRAKARVMNERSLDLLANAPRTVGRATPRPFETAASDSPYVV